MSKAEDTRKRIVASTADLLMQHGYHATGLNQIVQASDAPKGSLYFHFPGGKEEIVAEALRMAGGWTCGMVNRILADTGDAAEAVAKVALSFATLLAENDYAKSCALMAVAQEVGEEDQRLRQALGYGFEAWRQLYVDKFTTAGFPAQAAELWADLSLAAIEGAQSLSRAQRSTKPLENCAALLRVLIGNALQIYRLS